MPGNPKCIKSLGGEKKLEKFLLNTSCRTCHHNIASLWELWRFSGVNWSFRFTKDFLGKCLLFESNMLLRCSSFRLIFVATYRYSFVCRTVFRNRKNSQWREIFLNCIVMTRTVESCKKPCDSVLTPTLYYQSKYWRWIYPNDF